MIFPAVFRSFSTEPKIRGTPLGGSHCEGDLGRNLQVLRVEDRFKNIKEDHHADGIDDHHRNDHDLYDLNGRIKWPGEKQDQNNMDHLGNERDSKQKCIRVLAVFLLLPADKGTDDPWMTAESTQATVEIRSGKIRYR